MAAAPKDGRVVVTDAAQAVQRRADLGEKLAPANELMDAVRSRPEPREAAKEPAQPVADAQRPAFKTYEEADAYRREQTKRGASVQALPLPAEGGGFKLVPKSDPGYPAAEALREERRVAKARQKAGIKDGDILNRLGEPFTIKSAATRAANKLDGDFDVTPVEGGFVARPRTAKAAESKVARADAPAHVPQAQPKQPVAAANTSPERVAKTAKNEHEAAPTAAAPAVKAKKPARGVLAKLEEAQNRAGVGAAPARQSGSQETAADLAALHEANGPYPPSAATRIGEGQWQPAMKTGPSGGPPIKGAPTFADAGSAAAWAGYEQAKAREGADVAALERLQDAIAPAPSTTMAPTAGAPEDARPPNWRGNMTAAAKVARGLGIDASKYRATADLVRAIDAADAVARGDHPSEPPATAAPKKNVPMSMGTAPGNASAITVRDGVVHLGKYEALNYDTGEPITVPKGSTRADVAKALRDAGALTRDQKVFGLGGQADELMFSRSPSTKAAYEARIDALFAGGKAALDGVRVLDQSDMLGLLGLGNGPVHLAEGKVGADKHPNMTAEVWKKLPGWLDNPAAAFDSDTVQGRLVMLAPETVGGAPVLMIVEPNGQKRSDGVRVHLLQNAYDKDGSLPPIGRWLREGKGRYVNQKEFPAVLRASGLQLSGTAWQNKPGTPRILTDKNLAGWRRENTPAQSRTSAAAPLTAKQQAEVQRVQAQVDAIKAKWKNAPEVVVVANMQDGQVPQRVRDHDAEQKSQGATGEPEGFFHQGKVYIVAGQVKDQRAVARVLLHEALGHYGLRGVFGEALEEVLTKMAGLRRGEIVAKAKEYGLLPEGLPADATVSQQWQAMSREHRLQAAEEVLAEMAQSRPEIGWVRRAVAAIRGWLRRNLGGMVNLRVTNDEIIVDYILPARGWVERGRGEVRRGSAPPAYSLSSGGRRIQPVALSLEGWDGSQAQLRALAGGWYGDNLQGKSFRNDDMGVDVQFSSEGKRTAFATSGNLRMGWRAEMVKALPDLVKRAVKVDESAPDARRAHDTKAFHTLVAPLAVNGQVLAAKITLRESLHDFPDKRHKFYDIAAVEIENGPEMSGAVPDIAAGPLRPTGSEPSGVTVAQLAQSIKSRDSGPLFSRDTTPVDYTPEQARAAERAFGSIAKQTLAERAKSMRANLGTKLRQGLVDQFAPIKEVSPKGYILARLSKGSEGAVEAALLYGKPFLRDGVYDVDIKDGGFAQVLASLKGEHDRFLQWVAALRSVRLKAEGRENLLTDENISVLKTLNQGTMADGSPRPQAYLKALQQLNAFNEAALKVALESGLIDQAAFDLMKEQPYVPFYRIMEDEGAMNGPRFSSGLTNQEFAKKLKGGKQQINGDLLQNMLLNWSHLYAAAARNRAALATVDAAADMGVAHLSIKADKEGNYSLAGKKEGMVKVMRDGLAEYWTVEDPYLLDALSAMNYAPGGLTKAMAPFKRLLTFGVTVNPTFKIRNLIRDSLSAVSQADLSYNPLANVGKGWKLTARDSQIYASMLASGGIIKFGTQEDTNRLRHQIERLAGTMLDKQGWGKLTGQMRSLWEAYEEFGDRTENVNRAALYERLIAKGHSHAEASFMARDLMDFSMSGKWEAVRFLTQTVPFLNARLQGLYKLGRAAREDPRRFAVMAGAVSLASLGLMAAYGDDDDWKKREDWDRDAYWWFKIGDKAFRIPKPFELGSIGTVAERTAELMFSKEMTGKRFGQRISDMVFNTFAMDPTPQFIKPFIDVYANKDSFTQRPIEGMADERLRPQDRYNERTSEVARLLGSWGLPDPVRLAKGEYAGLSPKQIDFLLRGYFGWVATAATTATDMAARPLLGRGERPAMRLRDAFLAGNFVESLPTGSSRYVTAMYEQARDVEQAWASYQAAVKSGDMEKAREIQQDEAPKLRNRLAVAHAKQRVAELGQQAKRIESSRQMPADEKRQRLEEIEARKHQVAQRVAVMD